jgi:hypothetical protein
MKKLITVLVFIYLSCGCKKEIEYPVVDLFGTWNVNSVLHTYYDAKGKIIDEFNHSADGNWEFNKPSVKLTIPSSGEVVSSEYSQSRRNNIEHVSFENADISIVNMWKIKDRTYSSMTWTAEDTRASATNYWYKERKQAAKVIYTIKLTKK